MAIDTTDQIVQERVKHKLLQIAGATGQGGSPGQLYKPSGVTNPGRGEAVYGTEKDGQRFFEFLKAMMIDPANNIRKTGGPLGNDDSYGRGNVPGHPDWSGTNQGMTIAHSPSGTYDDYGSPLKIAPYKGGNPSGQQIEIPWMKEEYKKKHPELEKLHNEKYHPLQIGMNYPPPSELDKWLQIYQRNGGSLRHLDPDLRKLILQRGAMKAKLPANNISRLQDSGHTTVPDPENPGRLKIIDSLGPQAKGLDLGGGRSLGMPEIRALRDIFQGASEAERNKLIEKYSNRPFKGLG